MSPKIIDEAIHRLYILSFKASKNTKNFQLFAPKLKRKLGLLKKICSDRSLSQGCMDITLIYENTLRIFHLNDPARVYELYNGWAATLLSFTSESRAEAFINCSKKFKRMAKRLQNGTDRSVQLTILSILQRYTEGLDLDALNKLKSTDGSEFVEIIQKIIQLSHSADYSVEANDTFINWLSLTNGSDLSFKADNKIVCNGKTFVLTQLDQQQVLKADEPIAVKASKTCGDNPAMAHQPGIISVNETKFDERETPKTTIAIAATITKNPEDDKNEQQIHRAINLVQHLETSEYFTEKTDSPNPQIVDKRSKKRKRDEHTAATVDHPSSKCAKRQRRLSCDDKNSPSCDIANIESFQRLRLTDAFPFRRPTITSNSVQHQNEEKDVQGVTKVALMDIDEMRENFEATDGDGRVERKTENSSGATYIIGREENETPGCGISEPKHSIDWQRFDFNIYNDFWSIRNFVDVLQAQSDVEPDDVEENTAPRDDHEMDASVCCSNFDSVSVANQLLRKANR